LERAKWIKMPAEEVAQVSGYSIRVGSTQDLLALNIDLAPVMQAGRCKRTAWCSRLAGMARAAEQQGRDSLGSTNLWVCLLLVRAFKKGSSSEPGLLGHR
jgi:hypothetical protein